MMEILLLEICRFWLDPSVEGGPIMLGAALKVLDVLGLDEAETLFARANTVFYLTLFGLINQSFQNVFQVQA